MHGANFNPEMPTLPKLTERMINLFPEEYNSIPVSGIHLRELHRLDKIKNRSL
jgi:hypothetical protein